MNHLSDDRIRLQKYMSECGVASRRKSEELIAKGAVKVNGTVAKIGDSVDPKRDIITLNGKKIENKTVAKYIMLHKPRGFVTTMSDELGRRCVASLVEDVGERVYPIGRLDRNSEGLLLLTNDGEFANAVMHPSKHVAKVYRVTIRPDISDEQIAAMSDGMMIDGRMTAPAQVTVLESYPELIAREDRDIAASVKETLEKKGIVFRMNAKVQSVNRVEDKAIVTFADSQTNEVFVLEADAVLLATGRRPNTKDLNLEVAGVEVDVRGAIIVDEYLKTTNPNIRAVGDVKGGLQFTYISLDDYRIVREDLFGDKERRTGDRNPVSYSVFIDPPLSRVGLNEEEARRQNRDIIVKKLPVMAIPRAKTLGETDGLLKAIIDKNTGKILGCVLFAPDSGEVINTVAVAMKTGQDYTFLRDFIFTHPSMSEALNDLFS